MRTVHLAEGLLVADNLFLLHPPPTHPRTEPSRPDLGWRARAVPPNMDFYCASHFHEVLTTRRYRLSINRGPSGFVRHASADRETSDVSELDFRTVSDSSRNILRWPARVRVGRRMQLSAQRREKFACRSLKGGDAANPRFNIRRESGISICIGNRQ